MKTVLLSDIRDHMKTGDLVAFRVRGYGSLISFILKMFQIVTKSKYSHTGVVLKTKYGVYIVEAILPRSTITPITKVDDFYLIPTTINAEESQMTKELDSLTEVKYSLWDMFSPYIGMKPTDTTMHCSELCSVFYNRMGFLKERDSGQTPDRLVQAVKRVPSTEGNIEQLWEELLCEPNTHCEDSGIDWTKFVNKKRIYPPIVISEKTGRPIEGIHVVVDRGNL